MSGINVIFTRSNFTKLARRLEKEQLQARATIETYRAKGTISGYDEEILEDAKKDLHEIVSILNDIYEEDDEEDA